MLFDVWGRVWLNLEDGVCCVMGGGDLGNCENGVCRLLCEI
jgi:hypothetical protein